MPPKFLTVREDKIYVCILVYSTGTQNRCKLPLHHSKFASIIKLVKVIQILFPL